MHDGKLSSLRRVKDAVEEVAEGIECGLGAEGFSDWKEGDKLECYTVRVRARACVYVRVCARTACVGLGGRRATSSSATRCVCVCLSA